MSKREEEIEAVINNPAGTTSTYRMGFKTGAQWADKNPAPNVVALLAACERVVNGEMETLNTRMNLLESTLAAYHKATKGDES